MLRDHPEIAFPAGKEVHFWDRARERGVDWWLSLFPPAPPGVRQGEITPAYAVLEKDGRRIVLRSLGQKRANLFVAEFGHGVNPVTGLDGFPEQVQTLDIRFRVAPCPGLVAVWLDRAIASLPGPDHMIRKTGEPRDGSNAEAV